MTHETDNAERDLLQRAVKELQPILNDQPFMLIVGFDVPGGAKICSIANVSQDNQLEMMNILLEGLNPAPDNVTLN